MSGGEALILHQPLVKDTIRQDTLLTLPFPFKDQSLFAKSGAKDSSALYLKKPSNIHTLIEYDPISGDYLISEKIGTMDYRLPVSLRRIDFLKNDLQESIEIGRAHV